MKQFCVVICLALIVMIFPGCDDKHPLEKAVPWDVSGIEAQVYTVEKPGFSGLQYKIWVVEEGEGPRLTHGQYVCYHENAFVAESWDAFETTIDGDKFCRNVDTGAFPISGLEIGIIKMRKGAKYRFEFPPELAYGKEDYAFGKLVPPGSTVVYDIELASITN